MKRAKSFTLVGLIAILATACNLGPAGNLGGLLGNGTNTQQVSAFLPDGITLPTSELPMDDTGAARMINQDLPSASLLGYRHTMYTAANIVYGFQIFADKALTLGAMVRFDMTSTAQTQVEGKFIVNGQRV